ncbi:MAG: hypothetical protein ACPHRO_15100, partial [Nannocystaceae bacterium]
MSGLERVASARSESALRELKTSLHVSPLLRVRSVYLSKRSLQRYRPWILIHDAPLGLHSIDHRARELSG